MAKITFRTPYSAPVSVARSFDREKIKINMAGNEINMYDYIQKNNVDCDIYETLRKYNMSPTFENAAAFLARKDGAVALYGDLRELCNKEPRELEQQIQDANEMFDRLPNEIKQHFGNDKFRFMKEGEKYLEEMLKKQNPTTPTNDQTNNNGVDNEPKQ